MVLRDQLLLIGACSPVSLFASLRPASASLLLNVNNRCRMMSRLRGADDVENDLLGVAL